MRRLFNVLSFCVLSWVFATGSFAQTPPQPDKLDILTLRPSPGKAPFLYTPQLMLPAHFEWGLHLIMHAGLDPFVIYNMKNDAIDTVRAKAVSFLAMAELGGFVGILDDYMIGLSMPIGYIQGHEITSEGTQGDALPVLAWGDLAVYLRGRFYNEDKIRFGAELKINAPTGQFAKTYTGETMPSVEPRILFTWGDHKMLASALVGTLLRFGADDAKFFNDDFKPGPQITYGGGFAFRVVTNLHVMAEITGRSGLSSAVHDHPVEGGLGVNYYLGRGLHLQAGADMGIVSGLGTPQFRGIIGLRYAPSFKDTDNDGVPDEMDKCPLQKEDIDGFEDEDGCPDRDNDNDGIADAQDKCPGTDKDKKNNFDNTMEDLDGFQDDDGCPDLDNDNDGIPDKADGCPNAPGPKEKRGCPADMLDSDDDGVADDQDQCPNHPGPAEAKGCPPEMADTDGDGIKDAQDKCPKEAGEAKHGGCPLSKVDGDGDGVFDDMDQCPDQKETINGVNDFDGCPDAGRPWWSLDTIMLAGEEQGQIKIEFPSSKHEWFTDGGHSATLTEEGEKALGQVALVILTNSAFKKVIIMVFTDQFVKDPEALTTQQAETIKKFLLDKRVDPKRIDVAPLGAENLVYTGKDVKKQKRNRRVLFIIPVED